MSYDPEPLLVLNPPRRYADRDAARLDVAVLDALLSGARRGRPVPDLSAPGTITLFRGSPGRAADATYHDDSDHLARVREIAARYTAGAPRVALGPLTVLTVTP